MRDTATEEKEGRDGPAVRAFAMWLGVVFILYIALFVSASAVDKQMRTLRELL
jgi:hypothetical protein